jgi:hypothetical protein
MPPSGLGLPLPHRIRGEVVGPSALGCCAQWPRPGQARAAISPKMSCGPTAELGTSWVPASKLFVRHSSPQCGQTAWRPGRLVRIMDRGRLRRGARMARQGRVQTRDLVDLDRSAHRPGRPPNRGSCQPHTGRTRYELASTSNCPRTPPPRGQSDDHQAERSAESSYYRPFWPVRDQWSVASVA